MSIKSEEKEDTAHVTVPIADVESSVSLTFDPPIYIQRYRAIASLFNEEKWRKVISKVVDFGCSEFKLFKYLKSLNHIQHIYAVDVDETIMKKCQYEATPLLYEYLSRYSRNLTVDLLVGSIAEPDSRLVGVDAVACIELIEHLYPETLDRVPYTIFECVQPKIAVFTTPNSEFNVLFKLEGFRHYDHKFEWTRQEFENWCHSILCMYNNYEVYFEGIGKGPEGSEHLGCVSQMAVFTRREDADSDSKITQVSTSPYKLFSRIEYPFIKDERSDEVKVCDEIKYSINNIAMKRSLYSDYHTDDGCEIPVSFLLSQLSEFFSNEIEFRQKLSMIGYEITRNEDSIEVVKVIEDTEDSYSDDSQDDYHDSTCTSNVVNVEETWD